VSYSKGISWIDDCRIPFVDENDKGLAKPQGKITTGTKENVRFNYTDDRTRYELPDKQNSQGRFPANILVSDDMLNDGLQYKSGFNPNAEIKQYNGGKFGGGKTNENNGYGDKGTNSRYYDIDKWFEKLLDD
jgi:hypothetical protein